MIESIQTTALAIPFKQSFQHASAARASTQAIWVAVRSLDGAIGFGEGCPREYVTGESVGTAQAFVARHSEEWRRAIRDLGDLRGWIAANAGEIDANPAAWSAFEIALLDLIGKQAGKPVEALLGMAPLEGSFCYTAVIGDGPEKQFQAQLARYCEVGFSDFKIKLAGKRERDRAKVAALRAAGVSPRCVRADANNLWSDARTAIEDLRALEFGFFALEEPLSAGDYAGMGRLSQTLGSAVILDESMARAAQLDGLPGNPERWIANVRVSKMGGMLRSLDFVVHARRKGVRMVVGAHVGETSLLTRAALLVARAAGDALVGQEGAFGTHLLERDVVEMPLTFGPRGLLDVGEYAIAGKPGMGLEIREGA